MTSLIRRVVLLVLAWAGVFAPFEEAFAARTINTVTLNGSASVTVAAGASITVAINVTTDNTGGTNPTRWRSTGWRISTTAPGTVTCANHTNYDNAGTYNETFTITAPAAAGTYNAYFIAYGDDACSAAAPSATRTLTNGVVVVIPLAVTSATLNGATSVTVTPGATIAAVVNVTSNSAVPGFQWRSTGWRIDTTAPGTVTCVNHADRNTAGSYSESFNITAPNSDGTDNAYFIAYTDDACTTGASATLTLANAVVVPKVVTEFNTTGGTNATNGLHFYLEDATKLQVLRLNSGQVYAPGATPPSNNLDNGIFIRANGLVYGPSHTVTGFAPTGGMYNTYTITPASPPNPSATGVQQSATGNFGITGGPQVAVVWKYTLPQDFLIAEVTLTIPSGYPVSATNPVRYYHVFDTYLGGSDNGCGFSNVDTLTGKRLVGTYQLAGGGCSGTAALPAGVNVVESFRERSGQSFSSYCASGWQSFFVNGSTNCSVLQTNPMSQALSATSVDTGIGIEMDFTATGTYSFSYDFVIGSPTPPYDHLEIRHDGLGTLCPEAVTVLACTVSAVPCPAGNIVSTGALTGTITATGSTTVTATPNPFTVGSAGATASVALQPAGAGTVTLGASSLSTAPANGVRCYNTTTLTQSCSMTFVSTPCVGGYECQETGTTYNNPPTSTNRNPLYTKLSGTNFAFDVVALQSNGTQATTYTATGNVTVELFDDTTPAASCSAYASPVASQAFTLAASDAGRKTTANFNLPNAYSKLRCRVRDTNITPAVYGCSSDDFAVRPQQLTISAPVLNNPLLVNSPSAVAGTVFTLDANAGVAAGYTGTPSLNASLVEDHAANAIAAGTLSGNFSAGTGPKASGASFKYLDVGNLKFLANAVVDTSFTDEDSPDGDCVAGSSSNVRVGGKYGCNIGSVVSPALGRWVPSHYSFSGTLASTCTAGGLSFMDQDALGVLLTLKAHASTGAAAAATDPVLSRYTTGYTNLAPVTIAGDNGGAAIAVTRLTNPPFPTMSNTALWTAGQFIINDTFAFSKLAMPDGPYDVFRLKAELTDPDGALLLAAASAQTNTTRVRNGRVRLANAYGSELLDLPVLMRSEYWNAGGWVLNTADVCTNATLAFAAVATPDITAQTCVWDTGTVPGNSGKACTAAIVVPARQYREGGVSGFAGDFNLWLRAPGAGNRGSIDVTATVPAWLQFNWTGVVASPKARATFGAYRNPLIYRRENY